MTRPLRRSMEGKRLRHPALCQLLITGYVRSVCVCPCRSRGRRKIRSVTLGAPGPLSPPGNVGVATGNATRTNVPNYRYQTSRIVSIIVRTQISGLNFQEGGRLSWGDGVGSLPHNGLPSPRGHHRSDRVSRRQHSRFHSRFHFHFQL